MVIQARDLHLLRELSLMRVIDREQAKAVAGFGSTTRVNIRLLALTRAGLLKRFFLGTASGGMKALYALSQKGAQLADVPTRGPRRRMDEVLVGDFFVQHQLAINAVYCQLKYQPIPATGWKFRRWLNFLEPIESGGALIPDGYVEISGPMSSLASFLEIDLGNEGLSIWRGKTQSYLRYAKSGAFEARFQQPRFRVLVVANSDRRLQSIRTLAATFTEKLFWFSSLDSIIRDGIWSPVWVRPKDGQMLALL